MGIRPGELETSPHTCMVCGALPGTTCIDDNYQELAQVHPSRRMSVAERNWRFRNGWVPSELANKYRKRRAQEAGRAALFDPRLGPGAQAVRKAIRRAARPAS